MDKPLAEWAVQDVFEFFRKYELTPQQIIPVFGSGALQMATLANSRNESEIEEFYRDIAGELLSLVMSDLYHKMADHRTI